MIHLNKINKCQNSTKMQYRTHRMKFGEVIKKEKEVYYSKVNRILNYQETPNVDFIFLLYKSNGSLTI